MAEPEFSRVVDVTSIGAGGLQLALEATESERAALAARFELEAIERLAADLRLTTGAGMAVVDARGRLEADIVQTCVVSLELVRNKVAADVDITFTAEAAADGATEVTFDPQDEDPAEPMVDGKIDLGEALAQQLAELIDPYPRAPGATLDAANLGNTAEIKENPFAALAPLRAKSRGRVAG
jgi:hypothetical protein